METIALIYKELFEVEFLHSYYAKGVSPDLLLVPSKECERVLQTLGLRFLQTPGGGKLLARADKSGTQANPVYTIKNPLPDNTRFTFFIRLQRPSFETFTQTKLDRNADQFYYFNNLVNNMSSDVPLLVSNKTSKKVMDADLMTAKRGSYTFIQNDNAPQLTGELKMIDNNEVLTQELSNHLDTSSFSFDLAKMTPGRTIFSLGGDEKENFYNLPLEEFNSFFGMVEIFHRPALTANYKFQQANGEITTRFYKIPFNNRATRWRYFITQKFNAGITGVTVQKTSGGAMAFATEGGTPTGQFIVATTAAVPMQEGPVTGIQLRDQANKVLIPHLPNPATTHLKKEGADLFSDVFITI